MTAKDKIAGSSELLRSPVTAGVTLTVHQATPTLSITNSGVIYNGSAQVVTVSGSGRNVSSGACLQFRSGQLNTLQIRITNLRLCRGLLQRID
jgi:hypothetical protein